MAHNLTRTQLADAMVYLDAIEKAKDALAIDPEFGDGLRLWLPMAIPLHPDYEGEAPVAWLVANDFDGYDLTLEEPK